MENSKSQEFIYGVHPVHQALETGKRRCYKLVIEEGQPNSRLAALLKQAQPSSIRVEVLPRSVFRKKYGNEKHQGIIGYFSPVETWSIESLAAEAFRQTPLPTLALLDNIQDPQNLGAIIRSAYVLGVQGVVIPKHRSAVINETVSKCSAGAVESLPIATVSNLAQSIESLKKLKFWVVGLDMAGATMLQDFEFNMPTAVLIGGEEKGIRPLLKKACDFTVAIPMTGSLGSLNASAASAVVFYEIHKQREAARKTKSQ